MEEGGAPAGPYVDVDVDGSKGGGKPGLVGGLFCKRRGLR